MSCWLADLLIGPPTAFPLLGTGVPWVSLPGPTGVMTHPRQDDESPKRQPYSAALHWGFAALHWAEAGLHWLHSWRVHLQHFQTWPMLSTHLTTQENQTKLRRDLTWLAWLENSIDLDTPPQPCECTFAFTIVLLRCSLDLWLVHCVLSRYFSASLYCEVRVLPDSHHLLSLDFHHLADGGKFVLQLGLQLASALPSLLALTWPLRFDTDHGRLDLPRHSLPRRPRFPITLALCDMSPTRIAETSCRRSLNSKLCVSKTMKIVSCVYHMLPGLEISWSKNVLSEVILYSKTDDKMSISLLITKLHMLSLIMTKSKCCVICFTQKHVHGTNYGE